MASVVRASARGSKTFDPTIYPIEEKVGEDILQRRIMEVLRPLIERWFRERKVRAFVGADQFIYYQQHNPTLRVSPDIYVLPGVRPDAAVPSWKIWEKGIVPSFALEIASKDWEKDYIEAPERYTAMGVPEVIVFDPEPQRHRDRVRWQIFRRVRGRPLTRVDVGNGDRVKVRALGCHLRVVGTAENLRLRLGRGPHGDDLFPTDAEAERAAKETALQVVETERAAKESALQVAETERAAKEVERAAKEVERAAKEVERAAKEAAQARVAELEHMLRRGR